MTPSDGAYAGMTRLEPGVYDDGRGGMHVDLEEMLEANGFEPTVEAKRRLREAIARGGAREGIPVVERPR